MRNSCAHYLTSARVRGARQRTGEEVASLATWASPAPLLAGASMWFHDAGRLSDYQARYDCLCSSCLGPERIYTFTLPARGDQARPPLAVTKAPPGRSSRRQW